MAFPIPKAGFLGKWLIQSHRDPTLGLMLCYRLLEILNDFIFELVLCERQMSHVAIGHGHHEQHRHVRLQLACAWLSTAAAIG